MTIHWADVAAEKLADRSPHTVATGITPSGQIHLGNMREVMTADAVFRAILSRGGEARLIYIADTYDPLRRLYPSFRRASRRTSVSPSPRSAAARGASAMLRAQLLILLFRAPVDQTLELEP